MPGGGTPERLHLWYTPRMSVATILLLAQEAGAESSTAVNWFMPGKGVLVVALVVVVVAVLGSILWARAGHSIVVRKIAGLDAVDEAVGRATEMGDRKSVV